MTQDLPFMDLDEQPPVPTDIMLSGSLDSKLDFVATGSSQAMAEFLKHYTNGAAKIEAAASNAPARDE